MKPYLFGVIGLAINFIAPAVAQEKSPICDGPQEVCSQITNLIKRSDAAYNRKDAAGDIAMFASDGIFVMEGPVVSGTEALEKLDNDMFKAGWSNAITTPTQIHVVGNVTWVVGEWSATGPGPNNASLPYHGNWSGVYVADSGSWKARMFMVNIIKASPH